MRTHYLGVNKPKATLLFPGFHLQTTVAMMVWLLLAAYSAAAEHPDASAVIDAIGQAHGICAVLDDPQCTVARKLADAGMTVFVQVSTNEAARSAAEAADRAGLYGKQIFVAKGTSGRIGLADNIADAVIVLSAATETPKQEVLRVLRPKGKAFTGNAVWIKPRPEGTDDWSHNYHGPDNNTQSRDRLARAPLITQFIAEPRFAPGPQCTVASNGRVFTAFGHVAWKQREEPMMNSLAAFNAFNGTMLWKRPLKQGIMVDRNTMIATPGALYVGDEKSCKILDPATGKVIDEITAPPDVAGGIFWKWMALDDGVLYALVGEDEPADADARWNRTAHGWPWTGISQKYNDKKHLWGQAKTLLAIDVATKKVLWRHGESVPIDSRTACMAAGRAYFCAFGQYIACVDARSGKTLWRRTAEKDPEVFKAIGPYRPGQGPVEGWKTAAYMKCTEKAVYLAGPQLHWITALGADDGRVLWKYPVRDMQIIIRDDGVYSISCQRMKADTKKLDPLSGTVLAAFETGRRACTRATGTADSIYFRGFEGCGRLDLAAGQTQWISAMRPQCHTGVIVSDGHLYWMPWACDCDLQLTGMICCGPAGDFAFDQAAKQEERLELSAGATAAAAAFPQSSADWPTYRADNARTARSPATMPEKVSLLWDYAGKAAMEPTAPTVVNHLVFVSGADGVVRAIDASTGKVRWTAYAGGAVRYPPTIAAGRALVGAGDGWAYAFEAASGRMLWRFRAAPVERRIPVYGALLSNWPVAAGVLVNKGTAYFAAGITDYDGTHVYAVDAATGKLRWQNNTAGRLDVAFKRGVACQGELLLDGNRLYLAGGNTVSPGVFDVADGRCLNPTPTNHGGTAPRGRELRLVSGKVDVSGQPLYGSLDLPVYDPSVRWQPDVVTASNASLTCVRPRTAASQWQLAAKAKDKQLWTVSLPAEPVRWGVAVAADGRVIVALRNGHVLCYGRPASDVAMR